MERDDRGDGGKAHLEARACERFGPEEEDHESAGGNQTHAQGVTPQPDSGEDQQCNDATSHGRDLRAGQQSIANAPRGGGAGRDENEVEAKREPASSFRLRNIAKATAAAMWRPLTESR